MAITPPPRSVVRTPPTPLHGAKFDTLNTRRSTRQSTRRSQRAVNTPPPATSVNPSTSQPFTSALSPPSSVSTSPKTRGTKRCRENMDRNTEATTGESPSFSSGHTDTFAISSDAPQPEQSTVNAASSMLPTPAKTPRKKDLRRMAELQSAGRVLFPSRLEKVEDAMPNVKKRRGGRHVGFSMDSSVEDEDSANRIQIFTDSKEKVPELDMSEENPFVDKPAVVRHPEYCESKGRRGRVAPVLTNPHIEDVFNRGEGMVYVFRGKKIFRPFAPDPDHPNLSSDETEIEDSISPPPRPFTRSSVKPRLLFPTEKQRRERVLAEEEALTDIEDHDHQQQAQEKPITPTKQSFNAPATPPTTGHATRSATRKAAVNGWNSPFGPPEVIAKETTSAEWRPRKKTSPFDGWQRTKTGERKGRKRGAEQMDNGMVDMGNKKLKYNASV
ncbi:MAG: hypothetical protein Q9185_004437 [Variospora sp. 1 TL-2023]